MHFAAGVPAALRRFHSASGQNLSWLAEMLGVGGEVERLGERERKRAAMDADDAGDMVDRPGPLAIRRLAGLGREQGRTSCRRLNQGSGRDANPAARHCSFSGGPADQAAPGRDRFRAGRCGRASRESPVTGWRGGYAPGYESKHARPGQRAGGTAVKRGP